MRKKFYSAIVEPDRKGYASLAQYESILNATSLEELARELRKLTDALGFEHYLYGSHIGMPNGDVLQYIFSGYPEAWMNHYHSAGYIQLDPVVEYCFSSNNSTPLPWHDTLFDTPQRKAFMEDARGHGLANGLSIPLRGTNNEVALFSVATPIEGADAHDHTAYSAGAMYVMSSYLHEAIRNLVYTRELDNVGLPRLTPKEIECLTWWGAGKTFDEIGIILSISTRTVRFHLENAKVKLGVSSKSHAIARATRLGIIMP